MADFSGRPSPWTTLAKLFFALLAVGVLAAGVALPYIGGLGLVAGHEADKFQNTSCNLQESKPPQKTTLYARDGKTVIATLFSQDRVPIPLDQIPQSVQDALIATEDRRFYSHHGVDIRGLVRSAVSTSGGDTQGGSTLTMQYVKQERYFQAVQTKDVKAQQAAIDQNINRKIEDAKCALYIEGTLHESKGEILDNYLNIAFFGEHSYGIQTAAETYFNKPASKLTLGESATLVGLLRAPSAYDPFLNRAEATARRDEVLQNLVAVGKLSQTAADQEETKPIALATAAPPQVKQGCANASSSVPNAAFFCEYAVQWLTSVAKLTETQLETGGLKIVTTLDPTLQKDTQRRLAAAIPASSPMTAVLPAIDPHTGNILAMAASKTYGSKGKSETEQPIFTSDVAQGASTFKLFPLLAALETGVPLDWPINTVGNFGEYSTQHCATKSKPSNGDANEFYNNQETLRTATAKSSNTYFVALADHLLGCNLQPIVDIARQLGMNSLDRPSDIKKQTIGQAVVTAQRAQQLVLGSIATNPLELAGAYAAVANNGKFNAPAPILSITDSNGSALPSHRTGGVQVIAPQVAAQAADLLIGDTKSIGTSAGPFQDWYTTPAAGKIAGKTGTMVAVDSHGRQSDKNAAVWFVGATPDLVATSALINFDTPNRESSGLPGEKNGAAYGDYASKIWLKALKPSLEHKSWTWQGADTVPGVQVPDVEGLELAAATRNLKDAHFKVRQLDFTDQVSCASAHTLFGLIAYYGPHRAEPGSTITICPSSGVTQPVYNPPVKVKKPKTKPGHTTGAGGGNSGGGGGRSTPPPHH